MIRSRLVPLLASLLLAACHGAAPAPTPPLAGAAIGGPFALIDQNGQAVTDRSFAGRYRVMYFGYTFCPDVCPTDVATIGAAMKLLDASDPALAGRIVPIFVSVDPTRDTPPVLKQFVGAFHPRMRGLTGSPAAIAALTKQFGIYASRGPVTKDGGYLVNHTRQAYLMNTDGKPLALLPVEEGPQAVADEIKHSGALTITMTTTAATPFWELPIERLDRGQWEALCDGCGKCCIHKLEDEDTGELVPTNVACRLLDRRTGQCSDYRNRRAFVPECVRLSMGNVRGIDWLPSTCAYRRRAAGEPLPDWHYLVSGDREAVHRAGESVRGWTVSEDDVGDLENHIIDREL